MSIHHVEKNYDVVVIGGGLSGMCAALASARGGAKTAIVQNRSMFGGPSSSEVKMHVVGASCHMSKRNVNESGLLLEMQLNNKRRNPDFNFSIWDGVLWETVRFQENLDTYLNTNMDDVEMDGNKICAVTCHQNTTETELVLRAPLFVDATGHGTLAVMAGAGSRMGSEASSEFGEKHAPAEANTDTMGNTLMFMASDKGHPVPFEKPFWAYDLSEEDLKYRPHTDCVESHNDGGALTEFKEGESDRLPAFFNMDSGYWWIELGGDYDDIIASAEDIRDELLKYVYGVWNHIKNNGNHGADNYSLDWVGIVPGLRESRRIEGDYMLNENDIESNRIFDDTVAYGGWPMDRHIRGGLHDLHLLPSEIFNVKGIYTIPYRCYYAGKVDNLFLAGRDISCSKMAMSSTRVMGTCAVGGQAVGTAAALAVKYGCNPRQVGESHIKELQQQLLKDDCFLPGFANEDEKDVARTASVSAASQLPGREAANVINGVARTVGTNENCWESDGIGENSVLNIAFNGEKKLAQLRLTFDPDLSREIMPTITKVVQARQVKGLPPQLVKDAVVEYLLNGKVVAENKIENNWKRLAVIDLDAPVLCDQVRVSVKSTYGYENARIFEVRAYEA